MRLVLLGMAHWKLNHKDEARKWCVRAVAWMKEQESNYEELQRFHTEARVLLEIEKTTDETDKTDNK